MKFDRIVPKDRIKDYSAEISAAMKSCKDMVHILIEPPRRPRTTGEKSQNHHLNGHIQQISMETGQPFDDVKKYIKQQAVSMGYPMLERFGRPVNDMWGHPVGISEADASASECSLLIEQAHMLAAELGIILREEE